MPELEVFVHNRDWTVMRRMYQYEGLQVTIPLNGSRECRFTCPIYDINAIGQSNVQHFIPMRRFVRVYYRGHLIFCGPIVKPIFNFAENQVEVNCHDPSIWLKHHYIHEGDNILTSGGGVWPVDGHFLAELLATARLNADEAAAGFAELPIWEDTIRAMTDVREIEVRAGQNVWDIWMDVTEGVDGPDWQLRPTDDPPPPEVCALETWAPGAKGTDRRDSVQFHFGFARTNLSNFTYEPDGNNIVNRFTSEHSNGRSHRTWRYGDGIQGDGIMEMWEQVSEGVDQDGMDTWAQGHVQSYGVAPQVFTIEPTWDMGLMGSAASTPWRYPSGFDVGDYISGVARLGNMEVNAVGRVVKVIVSQLNEAENVASQVELMPDEVPVGDIALGVAP
jgi:hypothetical protein